MQNIFTFLKSKLLDWLLNTSDMSAEDLYNESAIDNCDIPDADGNTKFIGIGYTDKLVLTPFGYVPIAKALQTIAYQPYRLTLANGSFLLAADEHLVITVDGSQKQIIDLTQDDIIQTINGPSAVVSVVAEGEPVNMYDFEVDHPSHVYYTNGILSHNTTVIAAYLLWFACFRADKYVLVASKDNDAALDVMDRIRFGYEELPHWLKPGCLYFNRHEISFDNKSTIKSSATTENTGRGRSVSCVTGDTMVTLREKDTGKIINVSMADLYKNHQ